MRLAHQLVDLRVRREMHDEVDLRVFDPADAAKLITPRTKGIHRLFDHAEAAR